MTINIVIAVCMLLAAAGAGFYARKLKGEPSQKTVVAALTLVAVVMGALGLGLLAFTAFIAWVNTIQEGD